MNRASHRSIAPALRGGAVVSEPIADLARVLCGVALCLSAARAQAQAAPQIATPPMPAPATPAPASGSAPVVPAAPQMPVPAAASGPALTLHDAVQRTLRLHPAIALSRPATAARSPEVLAASAPFDPVLHSALGQNHHSQ